MNVDSKPPKGHTPYRNYDPAEIETVRDAAELFRWLAEQNRLNDQISQAAVYDDCAEFLEDNLIDG